MVQDSDAWVRPPKRGSSASRVTVGLAIFVIFLIVLLFAISNISILRHIYNGDIASTFHFGSGTGASSIPTGNPSISNGSVAISYPPNYDTLANYALNMINSNRSSAAQLSPVELSTIPSGQQHAFSMLYYSYFSHWDPQGFKPYMRYTLLKGTGFVDENVAFEETSFPTSFTTGSVEQAIKQLEYQMIYNDSSCCNNGHKDNILSPDHNRVSIGIAYDSTHVYFVQDFENYYANLEASVFASGGTNVVMKGNTTQSLSPTAVLVFFDSTPTSLSPTALNTQYDGPYTQGEFAGGVLPPCANPPGCQQFQGSITNYAPTWRVSSNSIDIEFSLSDFVQKYGAGVYTVYLQQGSFGSPEFLTSISIFVNEPS